MKKLKFPRNVEADPTRLKAIEEILAKDTKPIWEQSAVSIAHLPISAALEKCLVALMNRGQIQRGLENIETLLAAEQKGLKALQEKTKSEPALRVSRLLMLANDGSERFYRNCERLLTQNDDRMLVVMLDVPSEKLSEVLLGGSDKPLKAILISGRDPIAEALFSLIQ